MANRTVTLPFGRGPGVLAKAEFRGVVSTSLDATRSVSWPEVQAVVRVKGGWCVQLILESGEAVTLRAPTLSVWGSGGAEFEGDFHRIGQWWLAHRGESWRPVRPEAPSLLVQE